MATAVTIGGGHTITLSAVATDWSLASSPDKTGHLNRLGAVYVQRIRLTAAAVSDEVVIKDNNDTGGEIARLQAAATNDTLFQDVYKWCRPYLDVSACRLNTASKVHIDLG